MKLTASALTTLFVMFTITMAGTVHATPTTKEATWCGMFCVNAETLCVCDGPLKTLKYIVSEKCYKCCSG
jgi:hypothetical protein